MRRRSKRVLLSLLLLVFLAVSGYFISVYLSIRQEAVHDQAQVSDCIVVLGAAQYNGRPSPVLRARLDHALDLYTRSFAPRIITTGGYGLDKRYTEAGAAKDYLVRRGVPAAAIEADPRGETTVQSIRSVKGRMLNEGIKSCILVSDGFHLFRSRAIFLEEGINVYPSPAPASPIENSAVARFWHSLREVFVYTAFRLGIRI
jgi:uncharacterized SAM-binding protein YcdF (DUF218 family)